MSDILTIELIAMISLIALSILTYCIKKIKNGFR